MSGKKNKRIYPPKFPTKGRVYLDFASAAPVDEDVKKAMSSALSLHGNPSSLHKEGVEAGKAIAVARKKVADLLCAHPEEIIFTTGGTEGDNIAILGVVRAFRENNPEATYQPHIVTTAIEHAAVRETCRQLEKEGVSVTYVMPDEKGIINPKDIRAALKPETILVSVMYANNEIGTIEPIGEIAREVRHFRKTQNKNSRYPLFHTDAAQAINYMPIDMRKIDVDLLSFNGSKIYGPRGSGVLYKRRGTPCIGVYSGGNQEFQMHPGTENTSAIVGLAVALHKTIRMVGKEAKRLTTIRDYAFTKLQKQFPKVRINGHTSERLPNNINISFPGISSELLVIELDAKGIAVSSKSACKSDDPDESYVLEALYGKKDNPEDEGSIRISLGRTTTKKDIDALVKALTEIFQKMKPWL